VPGGDGLMGDVFGTDGHRGLLKGEVELLEPP
jgi:hypothetical protein